MPSPVRIGRCTNMWWLRELRYSFAGKLLIVVVFGSVIGAGVWFGYGRFGDQLFGGDEVVAEVAGGETVPGEIVVPLTPLRAECERAKQRINVVINSTQRFSDLGAEQSDNFFEVYSTATRACTYLEFIEFERQIVVPWAGGAIGAGSGLGSTEAGS